MGSRYRRFPSMQSLIGFEAAARHLSFSKAADELSMTQSAVSHQIRGLEDLLGQPLFRRQGRSIELTDAGHDMLETTRRSLRALEVGLGRLNFYAKPGSVVVSCPPDFARHWLLPRLASLREAHPDIDPWIVSTEAEVDFVHTESDVFISLGDDDWPGLLCEQVSAERLTPMCSPAYRKRSGRKRFTASVLAQLDLLHDESWEGWSRWFEVAGLEGSSPVQGYNFSDPGLAMDAAIAGQGVVLGSRFLAQAALADGRLVELVDQPIERQARWHLVADPKRIEGDAERRLWDWLLDQCRAPAVA